MRNFKMLNNEVLKRMSTEEKLNYYKKIREYFASKTSIKNININKIFHALCLFLMRQTYKFDIEIFNDDRVGYKGNVIYAVNHTNSHDFPVTCNAIKNHAYVLAENGVKGINRFGFLLNGVIFIERKDKEDRIYSKEKALELLCRGENLIVYPEGTWNMDKSRIMLDIYGGVIDFAMISGVPIVPIAIEYTKEKVFINIGREMFVKDTENRKNKIEELRDCMSSLRWYVWESFGQFKREEIDPDEHEKTINFYLSEYPDLNVSYEQDIVLKKYVDEDEVFACLKDVEIGSNNAFLAKTKRYFMREHD